MRSLEASKYCLFFFVILLGVAFVGCEDFTLEVAPQIHLKTTAGLDLVNGAGYYSDTVRVGETYQATLHFSKGDYGKDISAFIDGDGSFRYSLIEEKEGEYLLSATLAQEGAYTYRYFWKGLYGQCERAASSAVIIRLVVINNYDAI